MAMTPDVPSRFLASLPDAATVKVFDSADACGLVINWSASGYGFGEITIVRNKADGHWRVDDEDISVKETVRILEALGANLDGSGPGWEPITFGPDGAGGGLIPPRNNNADTK